MTAMTADSFRPIGDRAFVRLDKRETVSHGGIILPDKAKRQACYGVVLAVGSGRTLTNGDRLPLPVKPGDRVTFGRYAGFELRFKDDDREYKTLQSTEILAIISE